MEEYENWKLELIKKGAHAAYFNSYGFPSFRTNPDFAVLNNLPEFNMEKNMPVEDDENLAKKKDEW